MECTFVGGTALECIPATLRVSQQTRLSSAFSSPVVCSVMLWLACNVNISCLSLDLLLWKWSILILG